VPVLRNHPFVQIGADLLAGEIVGHVVGVPAGGALHHPRLPDHAITALDDDLGFADAVGLLEFANHHLIFAGIQRACGLGESRLQPEFVADALSLATHPGTEPGRVVLRDDERRAPRGFRQSGQTEKQILVHVHHDGDVVRFELGREVIGRVVHIHRNSGRQLEEPDDILGELDGVLVATMLTEAGAPRA